MSMVSVCEPLTTTVHLIYMKHTLTYAGAASEPIKAYKDLMRTLTKQMQKRKRNLSKVKLEVYLSGVAAIKTGVDACSVFYEALEEHNMAEKVLQTLSASSYVKSTYGSIFMH